MRGYIFRDGLEKLIVLVTMYAYLFSNHCGGVELCTIIIAFSDIGYVRLINLLQYDFRYDI